MRSSRFIALALVVVTLAGCARSTGPSIFARNAPPPWQRPVATRMVTQPVVMQQPLEAPVMAADPVVVAPAPVRSGPLSIFARNAPPPWRRAAPVQAVVAAPVVVAEPMQIAGPVPVAYAPAANEGPYTLDSGDKLRVVVFGQDGLSNTYTVDPSGNITMPLIGSVPARGATTGALQQSIAARLRQGYIREPHVAVEVEAYRPFFILGEVTLPGQYPYVANMTVETAVAIAGGYTPRAFKYKVEISRPIDGIATRQKVPPSYPVRPGDTIIISERWF
jgi:polysaccharide export outer membrane protein